MRLNGPIKSCVKCRGCGKRILRGRSKYCHNCTRLRHRLKNEHIPPKGKKSFWAYIRKHGYKCRYSDVSLEIDDYTSPWYLVFSRLYPGDKNRIVAASALFNEMKSALLEREFRNYVLALDDHRRKHLKVKKRPVHWRLVAAEDNRVCPICGQRILLKGHKLCPRCARIARRMKLARYLRQAVDGVWKYLHTFGFVCYYSGIQLDVDDPKSAWYLVFDHWLPRDPRKIVVTCALVNEMKGDLTEEEFWYFIRQLANFYRNGSAVVKRTLKFWCRPYRNAKTKSHLFKK